MVSWVNMYIEGDEGGDWSSANGAQRARGGVWDGRVLRVELRINGEWFRPYMAGRGK